MSKKCVEDSIRPGNLSCIRTIRAFVQSGLGHILFRDFVSFSTSFCRFLGLRVFASGILLQPLLCPLHFYGHRTLRRPKTSI